MNIIMETRAVLWTAVGLWASGVIVGAIVSSLLTMFWVYRKGQKWIADAKEAVEP